MNYKECKDKVMHYFEKEYTPLEKGVILGVVFFLGFLMGKICCISKKGKKCGCNSKKEELTGENE